ncbi:hypothetical protein [Acuticoccus sediminis]|uniref:hypothetical protein n=1 Tax=Acuticoccus sediminis TaxID=2184697 RepID=UPI001CFD1CD7|nr:hypothetical protein [Acuticoccus sediminis]
MILGWPDVDAMWAEFCADEADREGGIVGAERDTSDGSGASGYVLFLRSGRLYLATFADDPAFPIERTWSPRPVSHKQALDFVNLQSGSQHMRIHVDQALRYLSAPRANP